MSQHDDRGSIERDVHLTWAVRRALEYCAMTPPALGMAVSSLVSDTLKHPDTIGIFRDLDGQRLLSKVMLHVGAGDVAGVRTWIEGIELL